MGTTKEEVVAVTTSDDTVKMTRARPASEKKPLKPILQSRKATTKSLSEGDLRSSTEASEAPDSQEGGRKRRRYVTFCAPEDNQVFICPPVPSPPWTSKAKRFIAKVFSTPMMPPSRHYQTAGIPNAGIITF